MLFSVELKKHAFRSHPILTTIFGIEKKYQSEDNLMFLKTKTHKWFQPMVWCNWKNNKLFLFTRIYFILKHRVHTSRMKKHNVSNAN